MNTSEAIVELAGTHASYDISPVRTKQDKAAFLELPFRAYRSDPNWRAPLRMMQADQLSPKKNLSLAQMTYELFLARKGGEVVGRIAAVVNPAHLELYKDETGQFGFLDTLHPDPDLVSTLLAKAEAWLSERGMKRMTGPFSFSINEECGLLIDGFDTPPMILMPHGRPDYVASYENAGLSKVKDTVAFHFRFPKEYSLPPILTRIIKACHEYPDLHIRHLNMSNFKEDVGVLLSDIFNDAWALNWGFIPFTNEQIEHMTKELRPLVNAKSFWIAEYKGKPIAFALFLPDLNELAEGLDGRLLPFGWAQLLYRLKIRGPKRARLPLAGLRREYHKTRIGLLAAITSFEAAIRAQYDQGVEEIESSWVLEDNDDLISMCRTYGMEVYKTYRIFEKDIE
ncbi:MAG: hypothetical protein AAGF53_11300 [Pseudomonadota bacterium]